MSCPNRRIGSLRSARVAAFANQCSEPRREATPELIEPEQTDASVALR
jgi:hypothetical protein